MTKKELFTIVKKLRIPGLCFLIGCSGWSNSDCEDDERVECYSKSYYQHYKKPKEAEGYIVPLCPDFQEPPCDCVDINGDPLDYSVFEYDCSSKYGEVLLPTELSVEEPYEFECQFGGDLCTEFDTYYFDFSEESYDYNGRPFYIRFRTFDWDISEFNYLFELYDVDRQSFLTTRVVSSNNENNQPVLRYIMPTICDNPPCLAQGVVKHDLALIAGPGNFQVRMFKESRETGGRVELATTDFNVQEYDDSFFNTKREFNVTLLKNKEYDLSNYSLGDRNIDEAIKHVFGSGKINLNVITNEQEVSDDFVDSDGNIILDNRFFTTGNIVTDIDHAMNNWSSDLYQQYHNNKIGNSVAIEVYFMQKYNLASGEPDDIFFIEAQKAYQAQGATRSARSTNSSKFYNTSIVFNMRSSFSAADWDLATEEFSLGTFLHELGHAWSNAGYNFNEDHPDPQQKSCLQHTSYCNGNNLYTCLWRTACIKINQGNENELSEVEYFKKRFEDPHFCEGHQQVKMNRLTSGND